MTLMPSGLLILTARVVTPHRGASEAPIKVGEFSSKQFVK